MQQRRERRLLLHEVQGLIDLEALARGMQPVGRNQLGPATQLVQLPRRCIEIAVVEQPLGARDNACLLYTSPSPRD